MNSLFYIDSTGHRMKLKYEPRSYSNLMEFIWDQGLEDWGDCRGRAWCGTCHIRIETKASILAADQEERKRLNQLSNKESQSRLACQIMLDQKLHGMEIFFIGDD